MGADKELIRKRFEASFRSYDRLASVQRDICAELAGLAAEYCNGSIARAMEVGAGTGFLTSHLQAMFPYAEWYINDISAAAEKYLSAFTSDNVSFLWGDAESIGLPEGMDMIASASTVQWFDDMPGFVARVSSATRQGGWLVLSSFGPENFREIRHAAGEGLDYYTADRLAALCGEAGYEVVALSEYTRTLRFETPLDVLRHIKATGVNSVSNVRWGCRRLAEFEERYMAAYSSDEGVALTYHPMLLIARKR